MKLIKEGESYGYDNLIAGGQIPQMTRGVKMLSGQGIIKKGSILTKDLNNEYFLIATNSQTVEGVLADDIDTDVETIATIYRQGYFNRDALIYGSEISEISVLERSLREINIITTEAE